MCVAAVNCSSYLSGYVAKCCLSGLRLKTPGVSPGMKASPAEGWAGEAGPAFLSSTVGIDEAVIKRYVESQEKVDKGQLKFQLDFGF
jgi:hypothetical protein